MHLHATVINVIEAYEPKSILIFPSEITDLADDLVEKINATYPQIAVSKFNAESSQVEALAADFVICIESLTSVYVLPYVAKLTKTVAIIVSPTAEIAQPQWEAAIVEAYGKDFGFTFCDLALNQFPGKMLAFVDRRQLVNAELSQIDATAHAQSPTPPSDDEINAKLESDIAAAEKPKAAGVSFFGGNLPKKGE